MKWARLGIALAVSGAALVQAQTSHREVRLVSLSGLCVGTVQTPAEGALLDLRSCDGRPGQRWRVCEGDCEGRLQLAGFGFDRHVRLRPATPRSPTGSSSSPTEPSRPRAAA